MTSALWIAKTGLDAQQTRMSVISNNLANVNTTGYKRGRAQFEDLLYQNVRQTGGQTSQNTQLPSGLMLGTGVRTVSTAKTFTQGNLVQTSNSLDLAINGRGFFQIQLPDGTVAYTRDGSFQMNSEGQIVTSNGYLLQPEITLPANTQSITIGSDGTVSAQLPDQVEPNQVGTLQLSISSTPPACSRSARICSWSRRPAARRKRAIPAATAWVRSRRVRWRPPTSTWWRNWWT